MCNHYEQNLDVIEMAASEATRHWMGVRVEAKGASGKLLTRFVTNARDDKFGGFT